MKFFSIIKNINLTSIALQIITSLFYFSAPYTILLYIYILMMEYLLFYVRNKGIQHYNYYLFVKFIFVSFLLLNNTNYSLLFFATIFQLTTYYFNVENVSINKQKINKIFSFSIVIILIVEMLYLNGWQLKVYDFFLTYLLMVTSLICLKSVRVSNRFCIKNEHQNNLIFWLQSIPISFFIFILIIYIKFLTIIDISVNHLILFFFILLLGWQIEKGQRINTHLDSNFSLFKYYLLPILLATFVAIAFWLGTINIEKGIFKEISTNVFSTIGSISIFNIASLLVLLQLNYQKYGSSYLLINILKSPILLLFTFLPSLLFLLNIYIISDKAIYSFLPTLFLLLSFFSTFTLFIYANIVLETNLLLRGLFGTVKFRDFENYKKNIITVKETNIDAISKIVSRVIENNDSTTSHSLFYHLACWTKEHIRLINHGNGLYWEERANKFHDFFKILISNLAESNNKVIHQNFLDAIQDMIIKHINQKNFYYYSIVYTFLYEYLIIMLTKKEEDIAERIYGAIYSNSSKILLNLPELAIQEKHHVKFDNQLANFKKIFIDKVRDIIDISIEKKNIDFLRSINLYSDLFVENFDQDRSCKKWDGKVLEIFMRTRFDIEKKDEFLVDNDVSWFYISNQYEIFLSYSDFSEEKRQCIFDNIIEPYFFDRLVSIYKYAIVKDKIKSDNDFNILWKPIYSTIEKDDLLTFKKYVTVYVYLSHLLFSRTITDENIYIMRAIWFRILSIDTLSEQKNERIEFNVFIKDKIDILKHNFPKLTEIKDTKFKFNMIKDLDVLSNFSITKKIE